MLMDQDKGVTDITLRHAGRVPIRDRPREAAVRTPKPDFVSVQLATSFRLLLHYIIPPFRGEVVTIMITC